MTVLWHLPEFNRVLAYYQISLVAEEAFEGRQVGVAAKVVHQHLRLLELSPTIRADESAHCEELLIMWMKASSPRSERRPAS